MTAFHPAYRLTVYAPRSVDPTEATVLTPAAGAPHSDQFIVTSIQGIAGAKPYLDLPTGRGGTIDALNVKTTVGALTVRLLDARVTAGGGNAARWVTAFLGDGSGGNILLGRKVKIEQSLDGGATWDATPYFTGRISAPALSSKLWIQLSLKDLADDLGADVFVAAPAAAVASYAAMAQIAPLGLLLPIRAGGTTGYGGFPLTTPLRGITRTADSAGLFTVDVDHSVGDPTRTLATQALLDANNKAGHYGSNADVSWQRPLVMIALAGTGVYHAYDFINADLVTANPKQPTQAFYKTSVEGLLVLKSAKAGAAAPPAGGTSIDFYIVDPTITPSERTPLLIDDVDPLDYMADLCAGYFGRLDESGAPYRAVPINAASFAAIDATGFIPWRNRVTKASKLNAELEAVCLAYRLAYYLDGSGAVTLVDLRRVATTAPVATLTDADLVTATDALAWQQDRESAVTSFLGTYYPEQQVSPTGLPKPFDKVSSLADIPDTPAGGIVELAGVSVLTAEIGGRSVDMKPSTLNVDVKGFRFRVGSSASDTETMPNAPAVLRADAIQKHLTAYSDDLTGPFGLGPAYIDLLCRRASANAVAITQGKYAALTLTALPDPATNQRGGSRLAFCVSRTEDGPRIKLRMLDAGANAVAIVPTFGTPTVTSGVVSVPITLNAASEPVRLAYAATALSVAVRPADTDPAWIAGPLVTGSGTATLAILPGSQRLWIRARSIPGAGTGFKLPSAWAYPATTHVDLAVISPPTALDVSGPTVDALIAAWTNGDPTLGVEIFLAASGSLTPSADTRIAPTLAPGSIQHILPALTGGTTYTVGVRHRDASGGVSTLATLTFVAGTDVAILDPPTDPNGFSGSQDPRYGFPQQDGVYGLAVAATEFPGYTEFLEAVESAPNSDSYGMSTTVAKVPNVQGDWTLFEKVAPNDGLRRQLSARHVRAGATASTYTTAVTVLPWTSQPLGLFSQTAGSGSIRRVSDTESADGTQRLFTVLVGTLVDSLHVHFRTATIDVVGDPFDFSDTATLPVDAGSPLVLRPDGSHIVTFSIAHPAREYRVSGRMIPYGAPPRVKEGPSWPFALDAAPPAVNAKLHPIRSGTTADLSIDIAFGISDGPVVVDVIEGDTDSTPILTVTLAAPATIDKISNPVLGGRVLPLGKDSLAWRVRITDVAGNQYWFGPASANRDPLPNGTVTVANYRSTPAFVSAFDTDTDSIRVTVHGGRTKTWNRAALDAAGSPVTYTVGDVLDDASTETALLVDETRTTYLVEYQGGGTWITIWHGDLHGQPSHGPTATARVVKNTGSGTEDLYITPTTVVAEQLAVYYRDGDTTSAPTYQLCVSSGDRSKRYLASGTEVGAGDYWANVDGVTGSPSHILAAIPLTRDQIKRITIGVEGKDSGVQAWLPYALSLLEQPWLESVALSYNTATGNLELTIKGGAHCVSEFYEIANNSAFTSATTGTVSVADGGVTIVTRAVSGTDIGIPWYARVTPYSAAALGGLAGVAQIAQSDVSPPSVGNVTISIVPIPGNTVSQGSVTLIFDGPANMQSARYTIASGTSPTQPVDATVASSGTLFTGGRTFTATGLATVNLGDLVLATVIPFSGTSGTGTQLTSVHGTQAFQTLATGKSFRISHTLFASQNLTDPAARGVNSVTTSSHTTIVLYGSLLIPTGALVTAWHMRARRTNGNGSVSATLYKTDTSGGSSTLGTVTHSGSGYQTSTGSLGETTDGSMYIAVVTIDTTAATNANDNALCYIEFDYTAPGPDVNL